MIIEVVISGEERKTKGARETARAVGRWSACEGSAQDDREHEGTRRHYDSGRGWGGKMVYLIFSSFMFAFSSQNTNIFIFEDTIKFLQINWEKYFFSTKCCHFRWLMMKLTTNSRVTSIAKRHPKFWSQWRPKLKWYGDSNLEATGKLSYWYVELIKSKIL